MAPDASPRGHLILKSHSPLPRFACAIPVPHPDTLIQQLRTTIVAILTGQVSAKTSSSSHVNSNGVGTSRSAQVDELSYSEHLKQVTIHEWRMKSLVLELRQNALIAPETRVALDGEKQEEVMSGFELQDDHECALLEHGDEVNLWLHPGQTLESLRLPKLSSKHVYGLPKQPPLDRSGTLLLGNSSSQSELASEIPFTSPSPVVREPMEPSSHSSSVSANPDIQFETKNRHWIPPNQQHRVVVVGGGLNTNNKLITANKKQHKPLPKEKPKRLNSADYFSSQLVDQQKQRESYAHQRSKSGPIKTVAPPIQSPDTNLSTAPLVSQSPELLMTPQSPVSSNTPTSPLPNGDMETQTRHSSQPSSPNLGQNDAIAAQLKARQASFIRAEKQERESKMRRAVAQKKMPSGALIVGPGVQGKFGNLPSSDSRVGGDKTVGGEVRKASGDSYGNLDAFVSFTAASSDAHAPARPHVGRMRRHSSRSGASEKGEVENRRPSEQRTSSFGRVLERKQSETSIKKAETPPKSRRFLDLLPPMPMPRPLRTGSLSKSWQDLLQPLDGPFSNSTPPPQTPSSQVAPSPQELHEEEEEEEEEASSAASPPTSSTPLEHPSFSTLQEDEPSSSTPAEDIPSSPPLVEEEVLVSTPAEDPAANQLSRAERRYLEVMKSIEAEREKQSQEEMARKEALAKRQEAKLKASVKTEEDQRKRKELLKWQMWEEIRARQEKESKR